MADPANVVSVLSYFRQRPIASAALATAIAAFAVLLIAHVTGADAIGRAFANFHPEWIILIGGGEVLAYVGYMIAYRSIARVHGHAPLALPLVISETMFRSVSSSLPSPEACPLPRS